MSGACTNILLSTLFSNTFNVFVPQVRDHVSRPHKSMDESKAFFNLILTFLDSVQEDERSGRKLSEDLVCS
jgi:hypothetical protein